MDPFIRGCIQACPLPEQSSILCGFAAIAGAAKCLKVGTVPSSAVDLRHNMVNGRLKVGSERGSTPLADPSASLYDLTNKRRRKPVMRNTRIAGRIKAERGGVELAEHVCELAATDRVELAQDRDASVVLHRQGFRHLIARHARHKEIGR